MTYAEAIALDGWERQALYGPLYYEPPVRCEKCDEIIASGDPIYFDRVCEDCAWDYMEEHHRNIL